MAMRKLLIGVTLGALSACSPPQHLASQGGVGFGDAPMAAPAMQNPSAPMSAIPSPSNEVIPSSEINSALFGSPTAPGAEPQPQLLPQSSIQSPPSLPGNIPPANPAVAFQGSEAAVIAALPGHAGISDEQDFAAVSSRESIETDQQRIAANRAQYQEIAPTALPQRNASPEVSDLVTYALNAPNRLGQPIYQRRSVSADAHNKACLRFATDEAAQEAFLKAGGPSRDGKKLDPDGDGFACDWDPTPFQKARGG
jgi:hypothetical protein